MFLWKLCMSVFLRSSAPPQTEQRPAETGFMGSLGCSCPGPLAPGPSPCFLCKQQGPSLRGSFSFHQAGFPICSLRCWHPALVAPFLCCCLIPLASFPSNGGIVKSIWCWYFYTIFHHVCPSLCVGQFWLRLLLDFVPLEEQVDTQWGCCLVGLRMVCSASELWVHLPSQHFTWPCHSVEVVELEPLGPRVRGRVDPGRADRPWWIVISREAASFSVKSSRAGSLSSLLLSQMTLICKCQAPSCKPH